MTTMKKTFAALVAALVASGAAFAEPAHTQAQDGDVFLANLYAQMDEQRNRTFDLVMANAEVRVNQRFATVNHLPSHRPFVNTFAQAHLAP